MTAENRQSAIEFVQAIDFGVYLDEVTPRWVPRNVHDAYVSEQLIPTDQHLIARDVSERLLGRIDPRAAEA